MLIFKLVGEADGSLESLRVKEDFAARFGSYVVIFKSFSLLCHADKFSIVTLTTVIVL